MGILDTILRRREPAVQYRTIDGGHPCPYPQMSDEQLYNYEVAFNVPNRTFDKPPAAAPRPGLNENGVDMGTEKTRPRTARQEPEWQHQETVHEPFPSFESEVGQEALRQQNTGQGNTAEDKAEAFHTHQFSSEPVADEVPAGEPAAGEPAALQEEAKTTDFAPLDLKRPVRTVTTRQPVEIITTRARHPIYKVHGYIADDDIVTVFTLEGRLSENGPKFLENVPEKHELHLNIYSNRDVRANERYVLTQHGSKEEADASATAGRIACVKVEFDR